MRILTQIGRYTMMLGGVFSRMTKLSVLRRLVIEEIDDLIVGSLGITAFIALFMGAVAGVVCYFACSKLKHALRYDDSLDAFGVHGVGGTLGALLTGIFATRACWNIADGEKLGLIESGSASLLVGQLVATLITYAFAGIGSLILLKAIDFAIGLRVRAEDEQRGLDIIDHGEEGYTFA